MIQGFLFRTTLKEQRIGSSKQPRVQVALNARMWELRAAVSLARLWQKQAKREESQQALSEIYGWFSEGFDTPDLRKARSLLGE